MRAGAEANTWHDTLPTCAVVVGNPGQPDFPRGRTQNSKSTVAQAHFLLRLPGKYSEQDLKEEDVSVLALPLNSHE